MHVWLNKWEYSIHSFWIDWFESIWLHSTPLGVIWLESIPIHTTPFGSFAHRILPSYSSKLCRALLCYAWEIDYSKDYTKEWSNCNHKNKREKWIAKIVRYSQTATIIHSFIEKTKDFDIKHRHFVQRFRWKRKETTPWVWCITPKNKRFSFLQIFSDKIFSCKSVL